MHAAAAIPIPRTPGLALDEPVPRHWFADNVVATHVVNGVNLLFPAGERFFVRSVKRYLPALTDEQLRERVRGFFGQEGRHAHEHERFFRQLEAQGFRIEALLARYEQVAYGLIEKSTPPPLRLATTVALEHYTALLAEAALATRLLEGAHPTLRALLSWHAAEEIEHRAVAFDVLRAVAPSHALRMAGLALGTACLGGFWLLATATLLWQDRGVGRARLRDDWRSFRARRRAHVAIVARGVRDYLRRDFHPSQHPVDDLAAEYLARAGLS